MEARCEFCYARMPDDHVKDHQMSAHPDLYELVRSPKYWSGAVGFTLAGAAALLAIPLYLAAAGGRVGWEGRLLVVLSIYAFVAFVLLGVRHTTRLKRRLLDRIVVQCPFCNLSFTRTAIREHALAQHGLKSYAALMEASLWGAMVLMLVLVPLWIFDFLSAEGMLAMALSAAIGGAALFVGLAVVANRRGGRLRT